MSINYNVDDYWENSYKPVISKDHFAKFLKGYPFQTVELNSNKYDDFFELAHIHNRMENGKKANCFVITYYAYAPFHGSYKLVSARHYYVRDVLDILHLFRNSVCMDYEYYKKHNLGFPKVFIHPLYNLHSGNLNINEDYLFLCDLYNYDPITKYINLGLNKAYRDRVVKALLSEYNFLAGSMYDLYIKTTYRQELGGTVELFPLVSKGSVLDKHLIYLDELWKEYLKENKNFTDDLVHRSIKWS